MKKSIRVHLDTVDKWDEPIVSDQFVERGPILSLTLIYYFVVEACLMLYGN